MLDGLLGAGVPRPYAEFMIYILGFFKSGYSARTTDSVTRILGSAPGTVQQYAKDHREAWIG